MAENRERVARGNSYLVGVGPPQTGSLPSKEGLAKNLPHKGDGRGRRGGGGGSIRWRNGGKALI
jgi:hypothetical protein